jgi:hypothetical protein
MLKMNPPTLAFAREMLASADCTIAFVPRTTGVEVMHQRGHIFVLSDLFLMAERMTLQERANFPEDGPDMWLLYPPLAGKHLRIHVLDGQRERVLFSKPTVRLPFAPSKRIPGYHHEEGSAHDYDRLAGGARFLH